MASRISRPTLRTKARTAQAESQPKVILVDMAVAVPWNHLEGLITDS